MAIDEEGLDQEGADRRRRAAILTLSVCLCLFVCLLVCLKMSFSRRGTLDEGTIGTLCFLFSLFRIKKDNTKQDNKGDADRILVVKK